MRNIILEKEDVVALPTLLLFLGFFFDILSETLSILSGKTWPLAMASIVFYSSAIIAGFAISYLSNLTVTAISLMLCGAISWGLYFSRYLELWVPLLLTLSHIAGYLASIYREGVERSGS